MVGNGFTVITRLVESTATWTSITTVQFGIEDSILLFILSLSSLMKLNCFGQSSKSLTMKIWRIFIFNPRGCFS
ncbi:hypothetical protein AAW02_17210 (plasmid) [Aeromonas dhakensis]|nr:hypothetical protein AAW03_19295 [Aeromonas dhakensis]PHS84817.1 hypothetical protein AAW02_17210 [Aeromonas dhakensis]